MPIVRVEMWTGRTEAQKKELARVITDAMVNIAHTTPEATIVVFEDENWAGTASASPSRKIPSVGTASASSARRWTSATARR